MKKDNSDSFSEDEIKDLIRESLKINLEEKKKLVKKVKIDSALVSTINEFLSTFVIIGYDLNGEPLILKHTKTHMERDALNTLIAKYLSYILYEA